MIRMASIGAPQRNNLNQPFNFEEEEQEGLAAVNPAVAGRSEPQGQQQQAAPPPPNAMQTQATPPPSQQLGMQSPMGRVTGGMTPSSRMGTGFVNWGQVLGGKDTGTAGMADQAQQRALAALSQAESAQGPVQGAFAEEDLAFLAQARNNPAALAPEDRARASALLAQEAAATQDPAQLAAARKEAGVLSGALSPEQEREMQFEALLGLTRGEDQSYRNAGVRMLDAGAFLLDETGQGAFDEAATQAQALGGDIDDIEAQQAAELADANKTIDETRAGFGEDLSTLSERLNLTEAQNKQVQDGLRALVAAPSPMVFQPQAAAGRPVSETFQPPGGGIGQEAINLREDLARLPMHNRARGDELLNTIEDAMSASPLPYDQFRQAALAFWTNPTAANRQKLLSQPRASTAARQQGNLNPEFIGALQQLGLTSNDYMQAMQKVPKEFRNSPQFAEAAHKLAINQLLAAVQGGQKASISREDKARQAALREIMGEG